MHTLTKLYAKKMFRQKLIYIFFACFLTASFCYSFLISTPQMEEMLNIDIAIVGEENFPEFMMRFYVGTVGILFQVFLLTLYICNEDRTKMLYQPLLHGVSRSRMIKSKVLVAVGMSMIFVLFIAIINYITAFMRWGYSIFEIEAFMRTVVKYVLSGVYMSCVTLGMIALCIGTRNTWKTIVITIIYMILDSFICSTNVLFLKKIWMGYYPHLWMFSYGYQEIPFKDVIWGITIMVIYGIFFYRFTRNKIKKLDF